MGCTHSPRRQLILSPETMLDYKLSPVLAEMKKGARNNEVLQGLCIAAKLGRDVEVFGI